GPLSRCAQLCRSAGGGNRRARHGLGAIGRRLATKDSPVRGGPNGGATFSAQAESERGRWWRATRQWRGLVAVAWRSSLAPHRYGRLIAPDWHVRWKRVGEPIRTGTALAGEDRSDGNGDLAADGY